PFIRALERSGRLVRSVEDLPDDRSLAEGRRDGQALTSPELAVLLAYAKLETDDAVKDATLPDDPALEQLLVEYFPRPLRERVARWLLRLPEQVYEPPSGIGDVVARFDAPVAAVRAGLPAWLLGAEEAAYGDRSTRLQAAGVPADVAAEVAVAPLLPAALDL